MKPYAKERCSNPRRFYQNADDVLADAGLTTGEKEYILKSMAVDAELLHDDEPADKPSGEYPAEVSEIHKALNQLGEDRSLDSRTTATTREHDRDRLPFSRIVAAVAGDDDLDRDVVKLTETISRLTGGEVAFVSVVPPDVDSMHLSAASPVGGVVVMPREIHSDLKTQLEERRAEIRRILAAAGARSPYHLEIRHGRVSDEILSAAEESSAGLIVIGSHDRSWIEGLLSADTAKQVATSAKCPVLVVPESEKDQQEGQRNE